MKTFSNLIISLSVFLSLSGTIFAQVAINSDGTPPNSSAMLDIQSANKGLLLPRIDYNNRPENPVEGLLIYVNANGPYGNGIYMGTGTSWTKLSTLTNYIGQSYGGGYVFYVDQSGQHGLVATPYNQGNFQWGCNTTLIGSSAQHWEILTGDLNTAGIVAACSGPSAAKVCDTLTLGGYSDWYLPSIDELDSLRVHSGTVGGWPSNQWVWSSTEWDATGAMFEWYDPSFTPYWITNKEGNLAVRCIRKF